MANPTFNPAAKFNLLTTSNTFADWVTTTNQLVQQNNDLAANDFVKGTGTLYLNDPTLALQTNSKAVFGGSSYFTTAYIQNLKTTGDLTLSGNTIYQSNNFVLNANSIYNLNGSYGIFRPYGHNAELRWNETQQVWEALDVNNTNLATAYSRIVTANQISSSLTSTSTTTLATSNTVNTLFSMVTATSAGASNTFIGTSGSANPVNGVVTLRSNNGISIVGNSNTITISTSQDLRNTATPTFASLNLTAPLAVSQGGTGANNFLGALNNLLPPTGQISGYVLTTTGTGQYYWGVGGGGGGGSGGNVITTYRKYYTAIDGQSIFTGTPTYTMGSGQLRLYVNGVRQYGSEYSETSNTSFSLTNSATGGDLILAEVDAYTSAFFANNTAYTANTQYLSLGQNTIQLALDGALGFTKTAYDEANAAYALANSAYAAANNVTPQIQPAFNQANAALIQASAAFNKANAAVVSVVGTTNQISANTSNGAVTLSLPQSISTTSNAQFASIGVGTTPDSANSGSLRATGDIVAFFSDDGLKDRIGTIDNALDKLCSLTGFYYTPNEQAQKFGYGNERMVGVSAQDTKKVLPEIVKDAPIGHGYMTVQYDKFAPLIIEAIKELRKEVNEIKGLIK